MGAERTASGTETIMGTVTANGAAQSGIPRLRVDDAMRAPSPGDMGELRRALAATRLRFGAALRQIERMRRQDALRTQEAALLADAVVKAQRFAYHDELTGLPSRRLLLDRFQLAAALAERHDQHVALLFLDLDRFKYINDKLGHSTGDKLLQQVAARLVACLRASDTACRYGGDEFVILLPELSGKDGAVVVADNIQARLAAPYRVDGADITMTASLGIAMHPIDAHDYGDLLRISDVAMYRNKARCGAAPSIAEATPAALLDQ
jgi:diguanylate cyclase